MKFLKYILFIILIKILITISHSEEKIDLIKGKCIYILNYSIVLDFHLLLK